MKRIGVGFALMRVFFALRAQEGGKGWAIVSSFLFWLPKSLSQDTPMDRIDLE